MTTMIFLIKIKISLLNNDGVATFKFKK